MSVDPKSIMKIIFKRFPKNPVNIPELYANSRIQKEMPEMIGYLRQWNSHAVILRIIHISLGSSPVFFSVLAASGITSNGDTKFFAFVAAVSIGIMASFNLGEKSNNIRTAWRNLNAIIIKFNQNLSEKDDVIRTYQRSEALIGDVIFRREVERTIKLQLGQLMNRLERQVSKHQLVMNLIPTQMKKPKQMSLEDRLEFHMVTSSCVSVQRMEKL
jgi:hypothetical protein